MSDEQKLTDENLAALKKIKEAEAAAGRPKANPVFLTERWRKKVEIPPMADGSYGFYDPDGNPIISRKDVQIDITFDMFSDTPSGKDPDTYSPTLLSEYRDFLA